MEKLQGWAWIASLVVDAKPAIIVPWVQDEGEAVVYLRDEFVGFGGDQGEGLKAGAVGPLPRVPDACEGEGSGFDGGDGEDAFDGLGCFYLLCRFDGQRCAKEISRAGGASSTTELGSGV